MNPVIKFGLIAVALVAAATVVLPVLDPGTVPPNKVTRQRMAYDRVRILEYGRVHGQLPPDLSALPPLAQRPGTDHHLEDGWRRAIIYEVAPSGIVTLRSLGKDGVLGGTGANADIVFKFPSHDADGSWIQADYMTYDSYVPLQQ
jgi:hypothetical protein